jgi:hypothetical protein
MVSVSLRWWSDLSRHSPEEGDVNWGKCSGGDIYGEMAEREGVQHLYSTPAR